MAMLKRLRRFATYKYRRVLIYLRRITLPGFQGVPVYDVLRFFIVGLFDSKFTLLAAAMSYNFFFSAVPALFLLYTLLTYFPAEHLDMQAETRSYIENFVPHNVYTLIDKIATSDYASERRSGTIILGILLTVYGALRGIIAMMKAFTKDAETKEIFKRRNIFQLYSTAFILFIILASLFFVTIAVLVVGKSMINYMQEVQLIGRGIESFLLTGFTYFITLILIFLSVSLIYYLAPATQQRWKFLTPGGIVAGVLTFLTLIGYGYFISHIA
ncbi:MAG: YihY/virulence factor BrkB family protein, partial [Bacteroidetes bacterium]